MTAQISAALLGDPSTTAADLNTLTNLGITAGESSGRKLPRSSNRSSAAGRSMVHIKPSLERSTDASDRDLNAQKCLYRKALHQHNYRSACNLVLDRKQLRADRVREGNFKAYFTRDPGGQSVQQLGMSVAEITLDERESESAQQRQVIAGATHQKYLMRDQSHAGSATEMHSSMQLPDSDCESKGNTHAHVS